MTIDLELAKARFWSKVRVRSVSECWLWEDRVDEDGYGLFAYQGRDRPAHRFAYSFLNCIPLEEVPEVLHHECVTPSCCNAHSHLQSTNRVNHPDSVGGWQKAKTHCPKGHPYSGSNLLVIKRSNGLTQRQCKKCAKESDRKYANNRKVKAGDAL